jgi:hypothetical protein
LPASYASLLRLRTQGAGRSELLCERNSHLRGYISPRGSKEQTSTDHPNKDSVSRWGARILTGSAQPRTRHEHEAFLMAAFDPGDVFDLSNPDDVAEFKKLYRRAK